MRDLLYYKIVAIDYTEIGFLQLFYFGFNALEALAWFVIAGWVFLRWRRWRKSQLELIYALLFILFGVTDIVELFDLTVLLLGIKGIVLCGILWMRRVMITVYYKNSKF